MAQPSPDIARYMRMIQAQNQPQNPFQNPSPLGTNVAGAWPTALNARAPGVPGPSPLGGGSGGGIGDGEGGSPLVGVPDVPQVGQGEATQQRPEPSRGGRGSEIAKALLGVVGAGVSGYAAAKAGRSSDWSAQRLKAENQRGKAFVLDMIKNVARYDRDIANGVSVSQAARNSSSWIFEKRVKKLIADKRNPSDSIEVGRSMLDDPAGVIEEIRDQIPFMAKVYDIPLPKGWYGDPSSAFHTRAIEGGLTPGSDEYNRFILGKKDQDQDQDQDQDKGTTRQQHALAAGLEPGTEPYKKYMLSGKPEEAVASMPADLFKSLNPAIQPEAMALYKAVGGGKDGAKEVLAFRRYHRDTKKFDRLEKKAGTDRRETLEGVIQDSLLGIDTIDKIFALSNYDEDEGVYESAAVGLSSLVLTAPGSESKDIELYTETLQAKLFMTAIQKMRGLGSLSDAEGSKAAAAILTLNVAQSEAAYYEALGVLRAIFQKGEAKSQALLSGTPFPDDWQPTPYADPRPPKDTLETTDQVITVTSKAEYDALPTGTRYKQPDGSSWTK